MAQETRIGLLVGLAFIICFAVVLANRGKQDPLSNPMPYGMFVSREVGNATPTQPPAPGTVRLPPHPESSGTAADVARASGAEDPTQTRPHFPAVRRNASLEEISETPVPREFGAGGAGAGTPGVRGPNGSGETPSSNPRSWQGGQRSDRVSASQSSGPQFELTPIERERARRLEQLLIENGVRGQERVSSDSGETAARRQATEGPSARGADPRERQTPLTATQPARPLPRVPDNKIVRYAVRSGDTLSRIAMQCYGTRSGAVIEAVFKANRGVLESPDELKVGDELILPPVPGFGDPSSGQTRGERPSDDPDASERASEEDPSEQPFRWYQVREKDRYSSIARDQLGDERRWREIYELNRDKFPDANLIRPGVRIKLPVVDAADSTGAGR
jgi:nucleoid-associated protein YgaU